MASQIEHIAQEKTEKKAALAARFIDHFNIPSNNLELIQHKHGAPYLLWRRLSIVEGNDCRESPNTKTSNKAASQCGLDEAYVEGLHAYPIVICATLLPVAVWMTTPMVKTTWSRNELSGVFHGAETGDRRLPTRCGWILGDQIDQR
jgi:hypothetical protein